MFIGFVLWELFLFQFFWILTVPFSLEFDSQKISLSAVPLFQDFKLFGLFLFERLRFLQEKIPFFLQQLSPEDFPNAMSKVAEFSK